MKPLNTDRITLLIPLRVVAILILLLIFAFRPQSSEAQVPLEFNYQGRLTNDDGVPITGSVTSVFKIIKGGTVDGGGVEVHCETNENLFVDANGVFSQVLGLESNRIDFQSFEGSDSNLFVEVEIDGETMLPRRQLVSVPFAWSSFGSVPVGGIVPFFGNLSSLPSNWMPCNGAVVVDPNSPLKDLVLPDLRDHFLRGESNPGLDLPSVGVASQGDDLLPTHEHNHNHSGTTSGGGHTHKIDNHRHPLNDLSGRVANRGADPLNHSYLVRDDKSNPRWTTSHHLAVDGGNSTQEGQHRHELDAYTHNGSTGVTKVDDTAHTHEFSTDDDETSAGGKSYLPRYVALHFIIRIK